MQFVKSEDLKPGMRLAKPIYNKMGVLLYERDTKLTLQSINSIENFGLIGIFILEPAEPVPPISKEDMEFEQFQTIYVFKLKDCMDKLRLGQNIPNITDLVQNIYTHYGTLDHKLNFTQNLRSSADFVYKHSISAAMLCAMVANELRVSAEYSQSLIAAALLYAFGFLSVPKGILDKGENLSDEDSRFIQLQLEHGYEIMRPHFSELGLSNTAQEIIQHIVFEKNDSINPKTPKPQVQLLIDILKAADKFDRMTAMNMNHPPVSELAAMTYFHSHIKEYDRSVITALADSIHILPAGACLDFSNGEKGLVLVENPADFLHPMILSFKDNKLYDLSDPEVGSQIEITDIMKTMDNRIAIDSNTLKHFVADPYIKETADRFRAQKIKIALRKQKMLQEAAMQKADEIVKKESEKKETVLKKAIAQGTAEQKHAPAGTPAPKTPEPETGQTERKEPEDDKPAETLEETQTHPTNKRPVRKKRLI